MIVTLEAALADLTGCRNHMSCLTLAGCYCSPAHVAAVGRGGQGRGTGVFCGGQGRRLEEMEDEGDRQRLKAEVLKLWDDEDTDGQSNSV